MQTIKIRQSPNDFADSIGMAKHNRSRLPGTSERLQVAENTDGRFITGFDEESYILRDNKEAKDKALATRTRLEKATGKNLSGSSDFWRSYYITIPSDEDLILNLSNPMHEVSYLALLANRYIAPDKEALGLPAYKDANYYAFTEEGEVKEEVASSKIRDKAIAQLSAIDENVNKMTLIGQYLEGMQYTDKLGADVLYKMLRAYITQKDLKFAKQFVKALNISTEDMQRKILVDKAFKARLIKAVKLTAKKSVYQFGNSTLGSTIEEVYTNLADATFSNDLIAIKNELEAKD